ncbi:MAG: MerC domain-containing protein [Myxococcota bacterium]|nr:MerC domain-containing protein [Myxococcota bacterium]
MQQSCNNASSPAEPIAALERTAHPAVVLRDVAADDTAAADTAADDTAADDTAADDTAADDTAADDTAADDTAADGAKRRAWLDRVGVGVSITCGIHCVAAALLAAAPAFAASTAPALGEGLEWVEGGLLWIALGVGSLALVPAYLREHRNVLPLILFGLGIAVIALVRSAETDVVEMGGTVCGVTLVAGAHLVNLRARGRLHAHAHSHSH